MSEHAFICPYCGELVTMLIEPTDQPQEYVEDCEVCCNPVLIRFVVVDDEELQFTAVQIEQ
jgi:hypothetical protein